MYKKMINQGMIFYLRALLVFQSSIWPDRLIPFFILLMLPSHEYLKANMSNIALFFKD